MPTLWKIGLIILVVCLAASIVIAIVRLATTPQEILGDGFRGLPAQRTHPGREGATGAAWGRAGRGRREAE